MNSLISINQNLTMSSREIAGLTGKRHADVMRDIRNMLEELQSANLRFVCNSTTYIGESGQSYPMYELDRDTTDTLLTGYSAVARMNVIKRWRELENQQPKTPQTYLEALKELVAKEEQNQQLLTENQQQAEIIEKQAPKVAFVDKFVDGSKLYTLTQIAKIINIKRTDLITCLVRDNYLYRCSDGLTPYEKAICKKMFVVKVGVSPTGHNYAHVKVTAWGLNRITEMYATELMEVTA